MFCINCGNKLKDDARFCDICGTKVVAAKNLICPACGNKVLEGDSFCTQCGTKIIGNHTEKEVVIDKTVVIDESEKNAEYNYQRGLECFAGEAFVNAFKYMKKAAEQGHAQAQYVLYHLYFQHSKKKALNLKDEETAKRVLEEKREAEKWLVLSAEQGFADALLELGNHYDVGIDDLDIQQDTEKAKVLYQKAIAQGNEDALLNLELLEFRIQAAKENLKNNQVAFIEAIKGLFQRCRPFLEGKQVFSEQVYMIGVSPGFERELQGTFINAKLGINEIPLVIMRHTMFGNAREALFTTHAVYYKNSSVDQGTIPYDSVHTVESSAVPNGWCMMINQKELGCFFKKKEASDQVRKMLQGVINMFNCLRNLEYDNTKSQALSLQQTMDSKQNATDPAVRHKDGKDDQESVREFSFGIEFLVKDESSKFKKWWDKCAETKIIVAVGLAIMVFVALLYGVCEYVLDNERNNGSFHVSDNATSISFDRSLYYTGITRSDLLRYPDDYVGSYVKFGRCYVLQVIEEKVYVVNNGTSSGSNYIVIDDRNNKGINALEGDQVTVFGKFSGNGSYGTSAVPIIKADRMIVNNVTPTDLDELAQALVNGINHNHYLYKSGETTYLGGASLQWVMAIYGSGGSTDLMIYDHDQGTPFSETFVPDVDGYSINMKFQLAEGLIDPISAGAVVPGGILEIFPIRVNGTLTKIEKDPFNQCIYNVTFTIESFEPYDS